ncbi:HalOD1 output domain-containing protein [Halocatena marina]|uniref:HalOD1 output domain-containing protein n=1 Tax=Halocatena marina TaxID=2934937 RepID=A0ABD5YQN9_9EURY|nr:HalOD1 output domain-containing protein [Halocatena marina]
MPSRESLSSEIIEAVAAREGVEPTELPDPLYDSIHTDALDQLFTTVSAQVTFEYLGYQVTVFSTGEVELDPAGDE